MADKKQGKQQTHYFTCEQLERPYGNTHHNIFLIVPFPLGLRIKFISSFILTRKLVTYTQDSSSIGLESWSHLLRFPLDQRQYTVSFIICVGKALSY